MPKIPVGIHRRMNWDTLEDCWEIDYKYISFPKLVSYQTVETNDSVIYFPARSGIPIRVMPLGGEKVLANKFLIGCDPEFAVLKDGATVNVNAYLAARRDRQIGFDHGGHCVELRPEPAKGIYTLVNRLGELLHEEMLTKIPADKWRAGAVVPRRANPVHHHEVDDDEEELDVQPRPQILALGGHIHVDQSPWDKATLYPYAEAAYQIYTESALFKSRIRALDHVTRRLEALDILPHRECESRRNRSGYGKYSGYRICEDEGKAKARFEYRTMASWLFDPKVAMVCLTAAKLASIDPEGTITMLGRFHDFAPLQRWFEAWATKDDNAARVSEKIFSKGLTHVQCNPDADMRNTWKKIGF